MGEQYNTTIALQNSMRLVGARIQFSINNVFLWGDLFMGEAGLDIKMFRETTKQRHQKKSWHQKNSVGNSRLSLGRPEAEVSKLQLSVVSPTTKRYRTRVETPFTD